MLRCVVTLLEVRLEQGGGMSGRIDCPPGLRPAPGQYLLAYAAAAGGGEALPTALFSARLPGIARGGAVAAGVLELAPPLPPTWTAGTRLNVHGPLGHGFSLPATARRVALVGLTAAPHRLLPLAEQALLQGAAVALYTRHVPGGLPPEVEALSLEALGEALDWADFMAIDLLPGALPGLKRRFGLSPHTLLPLPAQVLVQVPMPCGGVGECGLCAVDQKRGWKLACKDGPVFAWNELDDR